MALPEYLFASGDGKLYDTRDADWAHKRPLRHHYSGAYSQITGLNEVKAALRAGAYAWPGGYPQYFVTRDGGALSFDAVREQLRNVAWDHLNDASTGWRIDHIAINYEDADLVCDHTGKRIPAAYGDDDATESEQA